MPSSRPIGHRSRAPCRGASPSDRKSWPPTSSARSRAVARADSDVDVAVLIDRRVPPGRILKYRLKLMADLGAAFRRSDVDAVILNEASPLLAHRVLSQGTLVFERSAPARVRFQTKTASLYLDLIPIFETHIRYLKRNVREGRIVG